MKKNEKQAIRNLFKKHMDACRDLDFVSLAETITEDICDMMPNRSITQGKDDYLAYCKEVLPTIEDFSVTNESQELIICGDYAFERMTYIFPIKLPNNKIYTDKGKMIIIYAKGDDGEWRIKSSCSNSDIPLTK